MSRSPDTDGGDHPGAARDNGGGGVVARRAVIRWAWRLFRREWRQQMLVLGVLTVAVAAAIGLATAAYNLAPVSGNAEFGTGNAFFVFREPDPSTLPTKLAAADEWFGDIDVISHRDVPVRGSVNPLDYRTQDPAGPFGGPLLDLTDGRYPTSGDEIAVTDWVADSFDLSIGENFALDGTDRTVVGLVENPSDLNDEFALTAPGAAQHFDSVTMLVDATEQRIREFRPPGDTQRLVGLRGDMAENVLAAVGVFVVATVALFLVALVSAASFIVVAQRRQRQLGMMSALGATEKHLRLVMIAGGAAIGGFAALLGASIGVLGWIATASRFEGPIGYRVDATNVPWWLVAVGMALAVATAIGAAWWPARAAARVPTVVALSGRPPRPTAAHRSAGLAAMFVGGGIGCLLLAGDVSDDTSVRWSNLLLVAGGTVATVVGVLLISPLAIRSMAAGAARLPIAMRLSLRDLGRYQARSGAALAAISLALGVPVAVVASAAAAESTTDAGNLSDRQLIVQGAQVGGPFVPEAADIAPLQAGVDRLVAELGSPTVIALDVALDPSIPTADGLPGREAVSLGRREGEGWDFLSLLYVATPIALDVHGVDLASIDDPTSFLTAETGEVAVLGGRPRQEGRRDPEILVDPIVLAPTYSSVPSSFVTEAELTRRGWQAESSGRWLIQTAVPLTSGQLATARDIAAESGLSIEARDQQAGLARLKTGATATGMALALAILAMTVGLIRGESAGDIRTLAATGASSSTRRTLTAATAGALALLGAVLGIVGAYLALAAGPFGDLSRLTRVPVTQLTVIAFGTPLIAACAGWLVAGREPTVLARQPVV
jgi:putative ABC transport system permease protein